MTDLLDTVELRSDNAAGVAPEIMAALAARNVGSALAYGGDDVTAELQDAVREVFEHPAATVFPVTSGTAANALSLTAMCPPWGAVLCHETAHILNSECGATSMLGGGAVMRGVGGTDFRMGLDELNATLDRVRWDDPHHSQPAVVSFTQPSDFGTMYRVDELVAIAGLARSRGLRVHVDGARLANAIAAAGCSPADMTWRAGVDVVSLGATKNGAMSAEAIVCFDDAAAAELVYRTSRAGHVTSKMRFQSAQLIAYLRDGTWLRLAATANHQMARLAARPHRTRDRAGQPSRREHDVRPGRRHHRGPRGGCRPALLPHGSRRRPLRDQLADDHRRRRSSARHVLIGPHDVGRETHRRSPSATVTLWSWVAAW